MEEEKFGLKKFLSKNLGVDEDVIASVVDHLETLDFKKDEFLAHANDLIRQTYYVEKGIIRQFYIDEKGKEHTIMFGAENWFVSDRDSLYFNLPSIYSIQAVEDCTVLLLTKNFTQELIEKIPSFSELNDRLLHNHIRHLNKRIKQLLSESAEERYSQFLAMYPSISTRVPQNMIASYLGITAESLSRVRKEMSKKGSSV